MLSNSPHTENLASSDSERLHKREVYLLCKFYLDPREFQLAKLLRNFSNFLGVLTTVIKTKIFYCFTESDNFVFIRICGNEPEEQ